MDYRGDRIPGAHWRDGWTRYHDQEVTLYAESPDGYRWTKPDLNLYELPEFPEGNVVLDEGLVVNHNFSPFIDERPGVPAAERYKGLGGLRYPESATTSGTQPYFRAPHIYIALPTRFMANRSSITDIVFMAARPGASAYTRLFKEAFIRPGLGRDGWGNRSNYMCFWILDSSQAATFPTYLPVRSCRFCARCKGGGAPQVQAFQSKIQNPKSKIPRAPPASGRACPRAAPQLEQG